MIRVLGRRHRSVGHTRRRGAEEGGKRPSAQLVRPRTQNPPTARPRRRAVGHRAFSPPFPRLSLLCALDTAPVGWAVGPRVERAGRAGAHTTAHSGAAAPPGAVPSTGRGVGEWPPPASQRMGVCNWTGQQSAHVQCAWRLAWQTITAPPPPSPIGGPAQWVSHSGGGRRPGARVSQLAGVAAHGWPRCRPG